MKGDQGNTGVHIDDPSDLEIVTNVEDGGAAKALSAEMGKYLNQRINRNEVAISMGEDGDVLVTLFDGSDIVDAEWDEDTGEVRLIMEVAV